MLIALAQLFCEALFQTSATSSEHATAEISGQSDWYAALFVAQAAERHIKYQIEVDKSSS